MRRIRLGTLATVLVVACSGVRAESAGAIGSPAKSCYPAAKDDADLDELLKSHPDPCHEAYVECSRACANSRCDLPPGGGPIPIGGGCAHRCRADTREGYFALAAAFGAGRCW